MSNRNLYTITFPQSKFETIGPESLCWSNPEVVSIWYDEGAPRPDFVRLQPPADASEARLNQVKAQFDRWGIVVKLNKRENRKKTVAIDIETAPMIRKTARQVVMDKIESSNSSNKKLLKTICENAMAEYKV